MLFLSRACKTEEEIHEVLLLKLSKKISKKRTFGISASKINDWDHSFRNKTKWRYFSQTRKAEQETHELSLQKLQRIFIKTQLLACPRPK